MAQQDVLALAQAFEQTLSPDRDRMQQAEAQIKAATQQPGYSVLVLKLVSTDACDVAVRQAAAVSFKNLVKYRWVPSETDIYGGVQPISDEEKTLVKSLLPGLMLSTPARVQSQLSEALSIICGHDFPGRWPTLLPELVQRLSAATAAAATAAASAPATAATATLAEVTTIKGVLATANSIFKRYRNQYQSDAMVNELEQSQNAFLSPLLATLQQLSALLPAFKGDPKALNELLASVRYGHRIFFSLNAPGLTPLMESQLDLWMAEFHTYLVLEEKPQESDTDQETALDAVKVAVCANINLFIETNEEEFQKYLQTFAADVWGLLLKVTLLPGQDRLAMAGIRFLTTIARSVHYKLFADSNILTQVCESIVVPNLRVRSEDEEVFLSNWLEYVRRDAEGSDSDTRRRAAADLVRSLTDKFPAEVTTLFTAYIASMLTEYAAAPATNWKAKDCAIFMVLALTVKGRTGAHGATSTNQLVNIMDFYTSQVLPELASPKINNVPVLRADAIKFVTTFRTMLPKDVELAAFPHLINSLGSYHNVVHSYAALAIERLLSIKDAGQPRFTPTDLGPHLQSLLERLFAGFELAESGENEYLMKAVMRVIGFVGPAIAPVAGVCLHKLAAILLEVCKNPRNPGFNHFLFESVAALIRHGTAGDAALLPQIEQMLFPAFEHVLQQDVQEFHPYVFQVFAQLIELRQPPLPASYLQIFPPLLSPLFWERSGNVPALVRLLQAYLAKAPATVTGGGHLVAVLGVFQKLIASKAHDHEGFAILDTIVRCLDLPAYEQYMPTVLELLFRRLQGSRTSKFVRGFLVFLSLFTCKHGVDTTTALLDRVQPGIFMMLLQQVWLPNLSSIDGAEEEKVATVASAKLLCEAKWLQSNPEAWGQLRNALMLKLNPNQAEGSGTSKFGAPTGAAADENDNEDVEEMQGYSAAYARLANAAQPEVQFLPEVPNAKAYVDTALSQLYASGAVPQPR